MISVMQADIKRAELIIQSLQNDKETLKSALASAVHKKDELYKTMIEYKQALEKANKKGFEIGSHLDQITLVKQEIEKVKQQLLRRDDKIKSLLNRNIELEQMLDQQFTAESKKMYKKTQTEEIDDENNVEIAVEILIQKLKSNPIFQKLFKSCVPCTNYFKDLIYKGNYDEALIRICKFAGELMKDTEKKNFKDLNQRIPSFQAMTPLSNHHMSFNHQSGEDVPDVYEERINKLNIELQTAVAKSKEALSNKSFNVTLKSPKVEELIPAEPTHSDDKKNNVRVPKIKIIKRPNSKSAKVLPKTSILRKK